MSSIYARGGQLWARIKGLKAPGKWDSVATGYLVGQERQAQRYADEAQNQIDKKLAASATATGPLTVAAYAEEWFPVREKLKVRSWKLERGQLRNHVLPHIGHLPVPDVGKNDIRDLMRKVREGTLAARTVLEIYGVTCRLFAYAVENDVIATSPCKLKRRGRELPKKRDADSEWRGLATYTDHEVQRLFSDSLVPVERRVQYALKSLGSLRHEEMAALRWRHYDPTLEPLGALTIAWAYDSRACEEKETKTGDTRRMPVHPTLAKILAAWKLSHWERIYGRAPGPDDLIVPTRTLRHINASDAGHAQTADLKTLGLRVSAGKRRNRGGHDLRAWFITACQIHGAHRDLLKVCTHGPGNNVQDGYTRAPWASLCDEVAKLKCLILGGEVLELATSFATVEIRSSNRWRKRVSPEGIERFLPSISVHEKPPEPKNNAHLADCREPDSTETVARLATVLAQAVLAGDVALAERLARAIQERGPGAPERRPRPDLKAVP